MIPTSPCDERRSGTTSPFAAKRIPINASPEAQNELRRI
jgi:hypothetical protein